MSWFPFREKCLNCREEDGRTVIEVDLSPSSEESVSASELRQRVEDILEQAVADGMLAGRRMDPNAEASVVKPEEGMLCELV